MLTVTGLSANTSLGDPVTAAAAMRARLSRPTALDGLALTEMDGATPITGHPVASVDGFQGKARLLSLALPALQALVDGDLLPPAERVGFFLSLPEMPTGSSDGRLEVLDRLLTAIGLGASNRLHGTFPGGHCAFAMAVQAAASVLAQKRADACIVGAVDSLCQQRVLDALLGQGRIKTDDNPIGLQPGEAAVFLAMESAERSRRERRSVLARITGVGIANETGRDEDAPLGQGMMSALAQVSQSSGRLEPGKTFFVLDCNGEPARAMEWGSCQQRLAATMPGVLSGPEWFPAMSFGDTGAASGALAALLVTRSFLRGYAPGHTGIVLSSSDDGTKAALRIEPAE